MEYTSRKQRQKQLRSKKEDIDQVDEKLLADEVIFKEQKKRLRRQLNSVPTFSLGAEDMHVEPNTLRTRTELKKQKKIDEILKDIAVLPENEYLNEDTNLRILKKMSVAKKYTSLQLSPEQEEKMMENKEKFETITNQLWFLIRELDKRKIVEPEIGKVPTMVSDEKLHYQQRHSESFSHPPELHEELREAAVSEKIDFLEERLEQISLKNDELEDVLQELEKVVQEGKDIVKAEVAQTHGRAEASETLDDTLELVEYLEKLEQLNKTQATPLKAVAPVVAENTEKAVAQTTNVKVPPLMETKIDMPQVTSNTEQTIAVNVKDKELQPAIPSKEKSQGLPSSIKILLAVFILLLGLFVVLMIVAINSGLLQF